MHHAFKLNDAEHEVGLSRGAKGYRLHLGEQSIPINLHSQDDGSALLTVDAHNERVLIAVRGDDVFIHLDGESYQLRYEHPLDRLAHQGQGSADDSVRAPMPGSVVAVQVKAGDSVERGQTLLVMESMKMETTLAAPRDGIIEAVHFSAGQTFDRDALLITLESGATA